MNQKEIACKIANNMLEFLIDPTVIPVRQRLYFRPEEILRNEVYEGAKADAQKAYGDQRHNSDFYPIRNREQNKKEGSVMDRRTMIASLDVLAQNFTEDDPIATDLRTMAYAVSKMADDELVTRLAGNPWMDLMKKVREDPANKGKSVKELAGIAKKLYKKADDEKVEEKVCPKCGKPECACMKEASEEVIVKDFWTKEASDAVAKALIADAAESPVQEQQEEHEKAETPEEEAKEKGKESGQNDPRYFYQHGKAESKPEAAAPEKEVPAPAPVPEKKVEVEAKKEEAPAPAPVPEKKPEEVEAKKKEEVVDTSVLAVEKFDNIELSAGMVDTELTASEKAQLDQLFK